MAEDDWRSALPVYNAARKNGKWTAKAREVADLAAEFAIATTLTVQYKNPKYNLTGRAAEVFASNAARATANRPHWQPAKVANTARLMELRGAPVALTTNDEPMRLVI